MTWIGALRALAVIALAGVAAGAPSMGALARPKRPVVMAPPPPPPPPGPVGLPDQTLADAAAFQALLERADAASPAFASGADVAQALKNATAYRPKALVRDAIAYAAVAALDDPTFVASVRAAGDSPENRRLMVSYLVANPAYALLFKGSDSAAGLAKQVLAASGLKLYQAGTVVRQESYDSQHQEWSKQDVLDRPERLKAVEDAGTMPLPPADDHVPALRAAATGATPLPITADPIAPPYTPLVAHALQLAAIAALGEATDDQYDQLASLGTDDSTDRCLHMAKLNLFQCLAVAKPNYEDIFCLGQHAMEDAGRCLVVNAGAAMPPEPEPIATPAPVKQPAPVHRHRRSRS